MYHKNRKLKRTPVENSLQFTSSTYISNRFSPLETLKDQQVEEDMCNHTIQRDHPVPNLTQGAEIPTTVNGKISVKNKIKTRKFNIVKTQNSEKSVRVRINGDSHLRGMATKLKQYLNAKHQVSSIIKSGAKIKQTVSTQDSDRKLLGRRDYLIISAGSNDINSNTTINEVVGI